MELEDVSDPLFKGCTRPAMLFGVPLVPLTLVVMAVVLLSVWTNILLVLVLVPIVLIMRLITLSDDQQFRLLWLKFLFRNPFVANRNFSFWKASSYSPFRYRR